MKLVLASVRTDSPLPATAQCLRDALMLDSSPVEPVQAVRVEGRADGWLVAMFLEEASGRAAVAVAEQLLHRSLAVVAPDGQCLVNVEDVTDKMPHMKGL